MALDYIPSPDAEFDAWQSNFTAKVEAGTPFWGITGGDWGVLIGYRNTWASTWAVAKIKSNRTSGQVTAKNDARKIYEKTIRAFVKRWLASNTLVTNDQRQQMGLTVPDLEPSPRPAIDTEPIIQMKGIGGGKIRIALYVEHKSKRASLHPDANGAEMGYTIGSVPDNFDTVQKTITFSKAIYTLSLTGADVGKKLYAFFRWKNSTDDAKSGPWCEMQQVVIG